MTATVKATDIRPEFYSYYHEISETSNWIFKLKELVKNPPWLYDNTNKLLENNYEEFEALTPIIEKMEERLNRELISLT
jgi:hypothetical protein